MKKDIVFLFKKCSAVRMPFACGVVVAVALPACSPHLASQHQSDPAVEVSAQELLVTNDFGMVSVRADQSFAEANPVYAGVIRRILAQNPPPSYSAIEPIALQRAAFDQSWLPSLSPAASVDDSGTSLFQIGVRQVIYSNGRFQAGAQQLRADEVAALAQYLLDANAVSAEGIRHYIEAGEFHEKTQLSEVMIARYQAFIAQAERRIRGGVGNETELTSFRISLLEEQTELSENRARRDAANAALFQLAGPSELPAVPPRLSVPDTDTLPQLLLDMALRERAISEFLLEDARTRPQVSLEGTTSIDLDTGEPEVEFGLVVGLDVPITADRELNRAAALARIDGASVRIEHTRREVDRRLVELSRAISDNHRRLIDLEKLRVFSEQQLDSFQTQFLSGAVSIEESLSILGTYKRARTTIIDSRFAILLSQLEIAEIRGQLVL